MLRCGHSGHYSILALSVAKIWNILTTIREHPPPREMPDLSIRPWGRVYSMEIGYKETILHISIPEMKFCQVHSYKTSRWGYVCSLGAKWRRPVHDVKVFILYLLDYYKPWIKPFCTQWTCAPSVSRFETVTLHTQHQQQYVRENGARAAQCVCCSQRFSEFSLVEGSLSRRRTYNT